LANQQGKLFQAAGPLGHFLNSVGADLLSVEHTAARFKFRGALGVVVKPNGFLGESDDIFASP
jgi:hypothetical protein